VTAVEQAPSLPSWLEAELPFRRKVVSTPEGRIHAIDDGEGPAVLLMHGNPTWCFLWRKVIRALRATPEGRALRIVAPDLLGLGLSTKLPSPGDHSLARHIRAIDATLEALGVRDVLLVGQDWGGPIGVGAARALTARGGRVRAMLFANTAVLPVAHPVRSTSFHRFANVPVISDLVFKTTLFPVPVLDRTQGDRASIGPLEKRAYRWPLRALADRAAPLGLARMVPGREGHPSIADIDLNGAWVQAHAAPIGLVWGTRDPILGRSLSRHRKALSPRFVEETAAGHFLQEEVPDVLARAVLRLEVLAAVP
jgi:pimeloyl-ACP methyl ester carboxylesterase